jgi:hypothetical protein
MNLRGDSKVAIYLGSFSINYYHPQSCPLGLILCKCGIRIVGLEVLDLLEVGVLLYGTHLVIQNWRLELFKGLLKETQEVVSLAVFDEVLKSAVRRVPFVRRRISTTIVLLARANTSPQCAVLYQI